jgi:hypothetical protein
MSCAKSFAASVALIGAVLAQPIAEASTVRAGGVFVPAAPLPFETVHLRIPVDSCEFSASDISVKTVASVIQVQYDVRTACDPPAPLRDVDVRLGAYPAGTYTVDLVSTFPTLAGRVASLVERLQLTVAPRADPPAPPGARYIPIADFTGLWWNEQESGWGLSITQSARDVLFGALFVYDAQNRAQWFTMQPGRWSSATRWEGPLYRTTGPYFASPSFDPRLVLRLPAGSAVLDFTTAAAGATTARFTFTIDGITTVKTITRMGL